MKKLIVLTLVLCVSNVFAANLVNKDSRSYKIEVKTVGTTHTSISSNTTSSGCAPDGATVKIKETGSAIKVRGSRDVIIRNGKLSQ